MVDERKPNPKSRNLKTLLSCTYTVLLSPNRNICCQMEAGRIGGGGGRGFSRVESWIELAGRDNEISAE